MKMNKLYMIAALLGMVLVSCQKVDKLAEPTDNQSWTLTVQAVKDADTKGLSFSGTTLNAYWKKGEKVAVYYGGTLLGSLEVTSDDNVSPATMTGQITKPNGLTVGSELMLLFPGRTDNAWTYVGQDGSVPSSTMSSLYDYATAYQTVSTIGNGEITVSGATTFTNEQSVYRFGFKVNGSGDPIAVKSFILSSDQEKLVRTCTYSGSTWTSNYGSLTVTPETAPDGNLYYVAVKNDNKVTDDTFSFSIVGSDNALYTGTKVIPATNLGNGQFVSATSISVAPLSFTPSGTGNVSDPAAVL